MKLFGPILMLVAAIYTGCVVIAVAIYIAPRNPQPTTLSSAVAQYLGYPLWTVGLFLWALGIGLTLYGLKDDSHH